MNITDKIIFVNIKNSYEAMRNKDRSNPLFRANLYECTRKYWSVPDEKASTASHILGCYYGKVIEVIRIQEFHVEHTGKLAGRKVFEGIEQPDSIYMGMNLHEIFNSLANFRVKYYNLP